MTMEDTFMLFNAGRVNEASKILADELFAAIDRNNYDSYIGRELRKSRVYKDDGLTNGETLCAQLRALALVQSKILDDLTSLTTGEGD